MKRIISIALLVLMVSVTLAGCSLAGTTFNQKGGDGKIVVTKFADNRGEANFSLVSLNLGLGTGGRQAYTVSGVKFNTTKDPYTSKLSTIATFFVPTESKGVTKYVSATATIKNNFETISIGGKTYEKAEASSFSFLDFFR